MRKGEGIQGIRDQEYVVLSNGIYVRIMKAVIITLSKWIFGVFLPLAALVFTIKILILLLNKEYDIKKERLIEILIHLKD